MFLLNLFVWGSYPPISETIVHNPTTHDHRIYALVKLFFIKLLLRLSHYYYLYSKFKTTSLLKKLRNFLSTFSLSSPLS